MSVPAGFETVLARALAGVLARITVRIAEAVPADVTVTPVEQGVALTGRALSVRSLTDARLRDFAGLVR